MDLNTHIACGYVAVGENDLVYNAYWESCCRACRIFVAVQPVLRDPALIRVEIDTYTALDRFTQIEVDALMKIARDFRCLKGSRVGECYSSLMFVDSRSAHFFRLRR
jgi:hypothetical protein